MPASKLRIYHRAQLAAHRMQKQSDQSLIGLAGVTTAQAAVLVIIATGDKVSQRHVAEQLGLNESAMTAMVSRLLALELLARERDPDDARAWRLRLTRGGQAALKKAERAFGPINKRLEATFTEDELTRFAEYLRRVAKAFE